MHESPYRLGFGRVVRDARGLKRALGKVVRADPNGQDRLEVHLIFVVFVARPNNLGDPGRSCGRRGKRRRNVQHQNGVIFGIGEKSIECARIAFCVCVADDIDRVTLRPCRWQNRVQSRQRIS
jgi:hypothetical protein